MIPSNYSALDVAHAFLEHSKNYGLPISPIKLIKLMYIADGYTMAISDERLFRDFIIVKTFGVGIKSVYTEYSKYGTGDIPYDKCAYKAVPLPTPNSDIVEAVWIVYSKFSAPQLSFLTTTIGTPWREAVELPLEQQPEIISSESTRDYYKALMDAGEAELTKTP